MPGYKMSPKAAADIDRIFEFGIDVFGLQQATDYIDALGKRFDELAATPLLYPSVNHIRKGYRRSVCGVHSIYYRVSKGGDVEIIRIIHRENF